ncbi:hypothetical lipoprotein [Francisella cf. novicida Fx1]|uniref:hypothetical protein n=1 Tax=Francisella tularensis TaxID=263 RepID=UPI00020BCEDF|nr:hypothetical lipoprotein [Francisella cf. novicida Fx1]
MEFEVAHECVDHSCAVYVEPLSQTYVDQLVKKVKIGEIRHDVRQVNHSLKWYGLEGGNYIDADKLTELDLKQCGEKVCDDTKNPVGYDFDRNQEYVSLDVQGKMTVNNKEYDVNKKYNFTIDVISRPEISGKCNDKDVCVFTITKDSEGGTKPYQYYWYDGYDNVGITSASVDNGNFTYSLDDDLKHSIVMSTADRFGRNYSEDSNEVVVYAGMSKRPMVEISGPDNAHEGDELSLAAKVTVHGNKEIPAEGYTWIVPEGWEIVSGQGSKTLVVKVPGYAQHVVEGKFGLKVTDSTGLESDTANKTVRVLFDSTVGGPSEPELSGDDEVVEGKLLTLKAESKASGDRKIVKYEWKVDGIVQAANTDEFSYKAPKYDSSSDKLLITVAAIDSANMRSAETSKSVTVKADDEAKPDTPMIEGKDDVVEGKSVKLRAISKAKPGRTISGYEWTVNGVVVETTQGSEFKYKAPMYNASAEALVIKVVAIDNANVRSEDSAEKRVTIKVDSEAKPKAPMILGENEVPEGGEVILKAKSEAVKGRTIAEYHWTVNGVEQATKSDILEYEAPNYNVNTSNKLEVAVVAIDSAGISSDESDKEVKVKVDGKTKPGMLAIEGKDSVVEYSDIVLKAEAEASEGRTIKRYLWKVDGVTQSEKGEELRYKAPKYDANNNHLRVTVAAIDSANIMSREIGKDVAVEADATVKPVQPEIKGNDSVLESDFITLTAEAEASQGRTIKGYDWVVNGESIPTSRGVLRYQAPQYDANADTLRVTVVAIDNADQRSVVSQEKQVKVKADNSVNPKTPRIEGANNIVEGKTVELTAKSKAKGGRTIVGYKWKVNGVEQATTGDKLVYQAPQYSANADTLDVTVEAIDNANMKSKKGEKLVKVDADVSVKSETPEISGANEVPEEKLFVLTASSKPAAGRTISSYEWTVNGVVETTLTNQLRYQAPKYDADNNQLRVTVVAIDNANVRTDVSVEKLVQVNANAAIRPGLPRLRSDDSVVEKRSLFVLAESEAHGGRTIKGYKWTVNGVEQSTKGNVLVYEAPQYDSVAGNRLTVKAVAIDSANVVSDEAMQIVSIDADASLKPTQPTLSAADLSGQKDVVENKQYKVTADAQPSAGRKIVGYEWTVNNVIVDTTTTNELTQTAPAFNAIADNKLRVTVVAIDNAGQRSVKSPEIAIAVKADSTLKPTKPTLSADLNGQKDVVEKKEYKVTASTTANGGRQIVKYIWNVNGDESETTTNILTKTAPAYVPNGENKIKVTVIAVDSANQRSEESSELQIAVKVDTSLKPTKPTLLADLNGQTEVVENKQYKVTANATASAGREIASYEWYVNDSKDAITTKELKKTAPAYVPNGENKIKVKVVAIDNAGVKSEVSNEIAIDVKADTSLKPTKPTLLADLNGQSDVVENTEYKVTANATASAGRQIASYEWYVNGVKDTITTQELRKTAPAYDPNGENKIKVKVIAIDNAGVRSDVSNEIQIAVKAAKLPFKPGIDIKSGDVVQNVLIYPNKRLTLEATVPANDSAKVKEYRWYLNDQLLQNEKGKQLTYTTPAYDKNNRGLIFKVKAVGNENIESDASDETKLILFDSSWSFEGSQTFSRIPDRLADAMGHVFNEMMTKPGNHALHGTLTWNRAKKEAKIVCDQGYRWKSSGPSREVTAAQLLIANDFNTVNVGNVENTKGFYYEPGIEVIDNLAGQVTIDYPLPMRLFTAGCWSDDPRPW